MASLEEQSRMDDISKKIVEVGELNKVMRDLRERCIEKLQEHDLTYEERKDKERLLIFAERRISQTDDQMHHLENEQVAFQGEDKVEFENVYECIQQNKATIENVQERIKLYTNCLQDSELSEEIRLQYLKVRSHQMQNLEFYFEYQEHLEEERVHFEAQQDAESVKLYSSVKLS
jgi:hypothetical protein